MKRAASYLAIAVLTGAALALALPAIGQDRPESLLPPGFGDPAPPPPSTPRANTPIQGTQAKPVQPPILRPDTATIGADANSQTVTQDGQVAEGETDKQDIEEVKTVFDVPPAGRRSLSKIGIISDVSGGYGVNAFGQANGAYLGNILRHTNGPLASRWGSIVTRRMLASRVDTPRNINGADWAAERAWLLLRMGDAVVARQLVQQVDAGNYSKRLYEVAMQTFLANGDLGGMCPLADGGARIVADPAWKMARPICASLGGEQGTATALLNQARAQRWMVGVDYLLAEKAVGAGVNGRRSVKIEWDKVNGFNAWRHGLANATGIQPPARLYAQSGRHLDGWLALMPMLSVEARTKSAFNAASLGTLSNRALVDLYAQASEDPDAGEAAKTTADLLQTAYTGADDAAKVAAMSSLWDASKNGNIIHGNMVLTARAAALITPSSSLSGQADRIVASLLTAGFDRSATRWSKTVGDGSLGWGLLAVGAPGMNGRVSYSQLDDFYGNDNSDNAHKSGLLLAGLAGLGRADAQAITDFSNKLNINVSQQTPWTRAMDQAAARGESGTIVLLMAAGLQAQDWRSVPAFHLYHIITSLRAVGMDAEARMISAEAVTFG